jgi:uncharacterized membrane protein
MIMGQYTKYKPLKEKPGMNPIWRGIGCVLLVVAPLVSYALTRLVAPLVEATGYVPLELLGYIHLPDWVYKVPVLRSIASLIGGINNLGLGIVVFIVIMVLLTGIFSLIYVAVLQTIGPPRYGEMDAPPSKHKAKRYKR